MSWLEEQYKNTQEVKDGRVGGRGIGAFLWQQFVDEDKLNKEKQGVLNQQIAASRGEDLKDLDVGPNASTLDVEGAAIRKDRERKKTSSDTAHTRQMELPRAQLQQAETNANRSHSLALMQMADTKDQRAADLEYQKSRDRKDDLRYNERMDQLDRKDRMMMQQTLAAGLASLGAAFAL